MEDIFANESLEAFQNQEKQNILANESLFYICRSLRHLLVQLYRRRGGLKNKLKELVEGSLI
jgi:hypothetical protein